MIVLALVVSQAARKGFQSPAAVEERYRDVRPRIRAAIEADHLISALANLVVEAIKPIPPEALQSEASADPLRRLLEDNLQGADYLPLLDRLGNLAADHRNVARYVDQARAWGLRKGWGAVGTLGGYVYPAIWICVTGNRLARWPFIPSVIVGTSGLVLFTLSSIQEAIMMNRLGDLSRRYV